MTAQVRTRSVPGRAGTHCPLLFALLLSACGGGGGDNDTPILDDSQREPGDPVNLRLQTLEDNPLDGEFAVVAGAAVVEPVRFELFSPPTHGDVQVTGDGPDFTYTPDVDYHGTDHFTYSAGTARIAAVTVDIVPVNDPPLLLEELPRVIDQGSPYSSVLLGSDVDGDALSYSATNLPGWLSLDADTGLVSGTPSQRDIGIWRDITVRVTDAGGLSASLDGIAIEVLDINDPPRLNLSRIPARFDAREQVVANVYPDDPDGDAVVITVEHNAFMEARVDGGTVTLTAADVTDVTPINLVLVARDRLGHVAREIVPITLFPLTESGRGRTLAGRKSGYGVHLVVLGDGYREDQLATFRGHVENMISVMRTDPGINAHFAAWNVHMIETVSAQSGIDDDVAFDSRDTAFDAGYFCLGIRRLICADQLKMFDAALAEYPGLDQVVLLVNDSRYGGSGGSVAIAVANAPEIALHEMGHSIAGLADEYVDNLIPDTRVQSYEEGRFANVSQLDDPERVPWAHWIDTSRALPSRPGDGGVGVFEGAYYRADDFYRPTDDSRMRSFDAPLGPVNSEQWALSVYRMNNPVLDFQPRAVDVSLVEGQAQAFSVAPLFDANVQQVRWFLDGNEIGESQRDILLTPVAGAHLLELEVADVSGLIRREPPHPGFFRWRWNLNVR